MLTQQPQQNNSNKQFTGEHVVSPKQASMLHDELVANVKESYRLRSVLLSRLSGR
jgi:hypothetical protein